MAVIQVLYYSIVLKLSRQNLHPLHQHQDNNHISNKVTPRKAECQFIKGWDPLVKPDAGACCTILLLYERSAALNRDLFI